jgi:hypothetical protein
VTSVATSTGITGGPITSTGTLQIDPTVVPQLGAASNTFTGSITASGFAGSGANVTNVNAAELNGLTSSAFQPAGSYATLGANTFTGTQTVTGAVSAAIRYCFALRASETTVLKWEHMIAIATVSFSSVPVRMPPEASASQKYAQVFPGAELFSRLMSEDVFPEVQP